MRRRERKIKLRTKVLLGVGLFLLAWGVVGFLYFLHYRSLQANRLRDEKDLELELIQQMLEEGQADRALALVDRFQPADVDQAESGRSLQVESLARLSNVPRLLLLHQNEPDAFPDNEQAALLVARGYAHMRDFERYRQIRDLWATREHDDRAWLALEADALLLQGRREEAAALLASRQFEGAADCSRLARLALFEFRDDPEQAWELLNKALALDSRNPDVRTIRGRLLEMGGQTGRARVEFVAAHIADPGNPFFRDQLAEFYRRTGRHRLAMQTWCDRADPSQPFWMWLKLLFWSRVTSPAPEPFTLEDLPPGRNSRVLEAILALPEGHFWSPDVEAAVRASGVREGDYSELVWLRVLAALNENREADAARLLESETLVSRPLTPPVYVRLRQVLAFRAGARTAPLRLVESTIEHRFYEQLREIAETGRTTPETAALISGSEAFALTFLGGGWLEAALAMHRQAVIPAEYPAYVAYGIAQALRFNRGEAAALEFAAAQTATPELQLLEGEMLLAAERFDDAATKLQDLRTRTDAIGVRAAWLLATAVLERRRFEDARNIVYANSALEKETAGQELLARIDLVLGDSEDAARRYAMIVEDSTEAKVFMARQAFQAGDLATARMYTEQLVAEHPDQMQFRRNLLTIQAAEEGAAGNGQ